MASKVAPLVGLAVFFLVIKGYFCVQNNLDLRFNFSRTDNITSENKCSSGKCTEASQKSFVDLAAKCNSKSVTYNLGKNISYLMAT